MEKRQKGKREVPSERRTASGRLVVEPRWLLKAGLTMLLVALLCGYATLCLLFYQGQWQLVLRPVQTRERPAAVDGRPYEVVRFGPDGTGVPQRTAWWMPPEAEARYRHLVLLYLPSGDGSLNDARETLDALRSAGIGVFALNYRGYGESATVHPGERPMQEDAEAAWSYLLQERQMSAAQVIPYGSGVGAALALRLAEEHGGTAAVVLDAPRFDVIKRVEADARVRWLPVSLLLHDRFELGPGLGETKVPKLILTRGTVEDARTLKAADPKMTVAISPSDGAPLAQALRRFLDVYAPATPEPRLAIPAEAPRQR